LLTLGLFKPSLEFDYLVVVTLLDFSPDEQTPSHNEITVKRALYIGILRRAFSGEHASLLDKCCRISRTVPGGIRCDVQ